MSFEDCLRKAAKEGLVDLARVELTAREYATEVDAYSKRFGAPRDVAEGVVAQQMRDAMAKRLERRQVESLLMARKKLEVQEKLDNFKTPAGKKSRAQAAISMLNKDWHENARFFEGKAHRQLSGFILQEGQRGIGVKQGMRALLVGDDLPDIGRALFGEEVSNPAAKTMADGIAATFENLRLTANKLGADIGEVDRWALPQNHNESRMLTAGKEAWSGKIDALLDWSKMKDRSGNSLANVTDEGKREILSAVFDSITTSGFSKIEPGKASGRRGGSRAERLGNMHRFLVFKDYGAWQAYHADFADGGVFDAVMSHIGNMSREISFLQTFGPDPEAMRAFLRSNIQAEAGKSAADTKRMDVIGTAKGNAKTFDTMWNIANGYNGAVGGANTMRAAEFLAGWRNLKSASVLGSTSIISVPSDFFTRSINARVNKTATGQFLRQYTRMIASDGAKEQAIRAGLIADSMTERMSAAARYIGQVSPGWTSVVADKVMRLGLITQHTQAARWAVGMEYRGLLADSVGESFDALPFKESLQRHGVDAATWDAFRKDVPIDDESGAKFASILDHPDDEVSRKMQTYVLSMMEDAIPASDLRRRALLVQDTRPGTFVGEVARSAAMYKAFPLTMMSKMLNNILLQETGAGKAAMAAYIGLGLTMIGGLASQMSEITQGRNPINMNPAKREGRAFWGKAFLKGGALGVYGDFLFSTDRAGLSALPTTIAGPVAQDVGTLLDLTVSPLLGLASGKDQDTLPQRALQSLQKNTPGQSLFWARLGLDRAVFDQIQREVDPKAYSKFRRDESRRRKDFGQGYFWHPGQATPSEAPDLTKAWQ